MLGPEVARWFGRGQALPIVHCCHAEDEGHSNQLSALLFLEILALVPEVGQVVNVMQIQACKAP